MSIFLLCYCVAQFITLPFMIYVSSVMALLAPNTVRAQMIGLFLVIFTLLGLGAGPEIVAGLTDHLFKDETKLGYALAIVVIGGVAIAWAAMRGSLLYLRPAIERNQAAAALR